MKCMPNFINGMFFGPNKFPIRKGFFFEEISHTIRGVQEIRIFVMFL